MTKSRQKNPLISLVFSKLACGQICNEQRAKLFFCDLISESRISGICILADECLWRITIKEKILADNLALITELFG